MGIPRTLLASIANEDFYETRFFKISKKIF